MLCAVLSWHSSGRFCNAPATSGCKFTVLTAKSLLCSSAKAGRLSKGSPQSWQSSIRDRVSPSSTFVSVISASLSLTLTESSLLRVATPSVTIFTTSESRRASISRYFMAKRRLLASETVCQ